MAVTINYYEFDPKIREELTKEHLKKTIVLHEEGEGDQFNLGVGPEGLTVFAYLRLVEDRKVQYEVINPNETVLVDVYEEYVKAMKGKAAQVGITHEFAGRMLTAVGF